MPPARAGLETMEQRQKLIAADVAAKRHTAFIINTVNLENIVRYI